LEGSKASGVASFWLFLSNQTSMVPEEYGGTAYFWAHYSYSVSIKGLKDSYADYWARNRKSKLINRALVYQHSGKFSRVMEKTFGTYRILF